MSTTNSSIRETIFQVLKDFADRPNFQRTEPVLEEVSKRLILHGEAQEHELLTIWGDMFRIGILGRGLNLSNPEAPYYHITDRGRKTLTGPSRDPGNPDAYMAALIASGSLSDIAESYIREAVETYNNGCFKAAAVMVGCASEALILELRDAVVSRLSANGRKPAPGLSDWRAKTVLDSVSKELSTHQKAMPLKLGDSFQYTWPAFLQQIRAGRNDSGHPWSLDPITGDAVHASLLIFPEVLSLTSHLIKWINLYMP